MEKQEYEEWVYVVGLIVAMPLGWLFALAGADAVGYERELHQLISQSKNWEMWKCILFHIVQAIVGAGTFFIGFVVLLMILGAAWKVCGAIGKGLWYCVEFSVEGFVNVGDTLLDNIFSVLSGAAKLVWHTLIWPIFKPFEIASYKYTVYADKRTAKRLELDQLKTVYNREYFQDFHCFGDFMLYWDALNRGEQPVYPQKEPELDVEGELRRRRYAEYVRRTEEDRRREQEARHRRKREQQRQNNRKKEGAEPGGPKRSPYQGALDLLGLKEPFTRAELGARYKIAMKKAHPDVSGDGKLATRINTARDLILKKKGWK